MSPENKDTTTSSSIARNQGKAEIHFKQLNFAVKSEDFKKNFIEWL